MFSGKNMMGIKMWQQTQETGTLYHAVTLATLKGRGMYVRAGFWWVILIKINFLSNNLISRILFLIFPIWKRSTAFSIAETWKKNFNSPSIMTMIKKLTLYYI